MIIKEEIHLGYLEPYAYKYSYKEAGRYYYRKVRCISRLKIYKKILRFTRLVAIQQILQLSKTYEIFHHRFYAGFFKGNCKAIAVNIFNFSITKFLMKNSSAN